MIGAATGFQPRRGAGSRQLTATSTTTAAAVAPKAAACRRSRRDDSAAARVRQPPLATRAAIAGVAQTRNG